VFDCHSKELLNIMPTQLELVFHGTQTDESFEEFAKENGMRYWHARDLMTMLGYQSWESFRKAIQRALTALDALEIIHEDTITPTTRIENGQTLADYKLSRFGCYLVSMNGDPKKPQVAAAQAFFVQSAETLRIGIEHSSGVERVLIRDEISDRENSLNSVAKNAGLNNYAFFQNAGYRGMYNMNLSQLRKHREIGEKESPLNYMGKTELAANLFRITQTEEKIKNEDIREQQRLENAANYVGKQVRATMEKLSNTRPENLQREEHIKETKKRIKETKKGFAKIEDERKQQKLPHKSS
jgi:DNA-damage-inducible protein D